jgi:hypothetical protein
MPEGTEMEQEAISKSLPPSTPSTPRNYRDFDMKLGVLGDLGGFEILSKRVTRLFSSF